MLDWVSDWCLDGKVFRFGEMSLCLLSMKEPYESSPLILGRDVTDWFTGMSFLLLREVKL